MKEKYYTDASLKNDVAYQEFLKENTGKGYLKIRANAASEAIPITNLNVKVSRIIGDTEVIFYEGKTDNSGIINDIILPAPPLNSDDEIAPKATDYTVEASGSMQDVSLKYDISLYNGVTVIQHMNINPSSGVING